MDYDQTAATLAGLISEDDQRQLKLLAQLTMKRAVIDEVHGDLLMAYTLGAGAALGGRLDVDAIRQAIEMQFMPTLCIVHDLESPPDLKLHPSICPACGCATELVTEELTNGPRTFARCTKKLFTGCL